MQYKQLHLSEELQMARKLAAEICLSDDQYPWGEEEINNRLKVKDLLIRRVLDNDGIWREQEKRRRDWFAETLNIEFPESGRLILEYEDVRTLNALAKECFESFIKVENANQLLWHPDRDSIKKLTEKAFYQDSCHDNQELNEFRMRNYEWYGSNTVRNPGHRETFKPIVLSIALEDFVFCSDFSAYSSCLRLADIGEFCGGGRVFAASLNSAILLREDTSLVNVTYYQEKHDGRVPPFWDDFPTLPKKMGRRFVYFDTLKPTHYSIGREYGTLKWSTIPLIDALEKQGLKYYPKVSEYNLSRESKLSDMVFYFDSVNSRMADPPGDTIFFELEGDIPRNTYFDADLCISGLQERCERCGESFDELYRDGWCESCYDSAHFWCEVCDEYRHEDDMRTDVFYILRTRYGGGTFRDTITSCDYCEDQHPVGFHRYDLEDNHDIEDNQDEDE